MKAFDRIAKRKNEAGFGLLEVMIAATILVVGLLALTAVFMTAIGNNGANRVDSTSTMVAQSVIEQITAVLARGGPPSVADCKGNVFTIETAPGGAQLNGLAIDFTETSPPDGYWMRNGSQTGFAVCDGGGGMAGTVATYDVRWHISQVGNSDLVTVSARPLNMTPNRFTFSLPVTLRAYVGNE